jgi:hypothetical protein
MQNTSDLLHVNMTFKQNAVNTIFTCNTNTTTPASVQLVIEDGWLLMPHDNRYIEASETRLLTFMPVSI